MFTIEEYQQSAQWLKEKLGSFRPEILMVLGSGLGFLAEQVENPILIPYGEIPHFCRSTAPDHAGRFVAGVLGGRRVMVMQGRFHLYEGYSAEQVTYPIRVAYLLGVRSLLLTNAVGAINTSFQVGDLMMITDHIRLFDPDPLIGPNLPQFGPRFCDMSETYCPEYQQLCRQKAEEAGILLREGVYFYFTGPQFETPAEIRAARILGGDAAGMSTVPEAICANHCGMKILGISLVTNMAAGILKQRLDGVDVLSAAEKAHDRFETLVMSCLPEL